MEVRWGDRCRVVSEWDMCLVLQLHFNAFYLFPEAVMTGSLNKVSL